MNTNGSVHKRCGDMDRSTGGPSLLSEIKNPHISQQITEFQFRPGFSIPSPADTTGCVAGFYAQVSMAGRSMNRLWHKMVAAAVGSCIHVCRGSRGATGISLSRETGRGADPPQGRWHKCGWTSSITFLLILFLASTAPLHWKFSLSPYLHLLLSSPISPAQLRLCSRGNPLFPAGLFAPLLRWHPSSQ